VDRPLKPSLLIAIGGFAGSGKTTISRRLSHDLGWPRLEADVLGKLIRRLELFNGNSEEAYRIGYATLWRLCEEFLSCGISVIVDANMAWKVAWESVETLSARQTSSRVVPIILRCPRDVCLARVKQRYVDEPGWHGDPERFMNDHASILWEYLENLSRPEVIFLDANRPVDDVYRDVKNHVKATVTLRTG
jgi:predicted kinase